MAGLMRGESKDSGVNCAVCMENFNDEERRPLLQPACGHTFCKICLEQFVATLAGRGQILCPTCRRPQPVRRVQDLPINYSLMEVATREITSSSQPQDKPFLRNISASASHEEPCSEHGSRLAFWCKTCEVAACGECLFETHPRPEHDLVRVEDHLSRLQEAVKIKSSRIVRQLVAASEENVTMVTQAFLGFVEVLRQRRVLDDLLRKARLVRNSTLAAATDLGSVSSATETVKSIEKEFSDALITTATRVSVSEPLSPTGSDGSTNPNLGRRGIVAGIQSVLSPPIVPMATNVYPFLYPTTTNLITSAINSVFSKNASQRTNTSTESHSPDPSFTSLQPDGHRSSSGYSCSPPSSSSASLDTYSNESPKMMIQTPVSPSHSLTTSTPKAHSTSKTITPLQKTEGKHISSVPIPPWPSILCGVLSGNWTSGRITLEPRGLHLYALQPMKEKCDVFINLSVVSCLAPLKAPMVFLDLKDGPELLGRVYITLQIELRRAQQFFSLCLGDKGPSYQGSLFHAVLRRGDSGEGLIGGDYEDKAGRGGASIMGTIEGTDEIPKRCERGMVSRGSSKPETASQFCISLKDGSRSKTVFPFGRVCEGIGVVDEACRRPALTVSISNCGWVLPVDTSGLPQPKDRFTP